jgi:5-hydroxyisourate hydrolase
MSAITTHVLDTAAGKPAAGVRVRLEDGNGTQVAVGTTDDDGRVRSLGPDLLPPGTYRLVFDTAGYFAGIGQRCFYPEVVVTVALDDTGPADTGQHYHLPVLLSPFAYSTYRGS